MNLSIANRISLLFILLVALTGGTVTLIFYHSSTKILVEHALDDLTGQLAQESLTLTAKTETLHHDISFLTRVPPIQGIIRATDNNGVDTESHSTLQEWRTRLEQIFSNRLQTKPEYFQIRFIDAGGQELARVERKDGKTIVIPPPDLQNKAERDYVIETLQLSAGQVYLSDINLNREHGRIMEPYMPVLRVATPVFGPSGKIFGLVVINLDFSRELERISKHHNQLHHSLFITENKGGYLVHPDPDRLYSIDLGRTDRLQNDFPQLGVFFEPDSSTRNITLLPEQTNSKLAMVYTKIPLGPSQPDRFIVVGLAHQYGDIVAAQQEALGTTAFWSLLLILASILLAYGVSNLLVKPIKQISQGIDEFRRTQKSGNLPTHRMDEIGDLARSFAELMGQVRTSQKQMRDLNYILEDHVRTRTQELERAEIRQRTVLITMVDALITIDEEGRINSFNPAAEQMFGYAADEVIGNNIKMLMPEPYHSAHDGYLKAYKETGEAHVLGIGREVEAQRKDGSIFPADLAIGEMWFGNQRMYSGIIRDITERRRVEKMKNEFISTVSHELRTPLTSIRGSLGLISGGAVGELPEQAGNMLEIASNNTERLLLLINDILDIQKIESGQMAFNFQHVELMPLIKKALADNTGYAEQHGVSFEVSQSLDARIFADPDRLNQVMSNLLSNAAKFSPEGEKIEVSVAHHQDRVRISVSDHGPGIPETFHAKLFDKFTQSDSSDSRQKGGTGLGLNITKAIVEKHGGHISFVTKEGIGTTFFVDLPALTSDASDTDSPRHLAEKDSASILIVEDDPDIAALMQRILTEAGFNSDIARDAEHASYLLEEKNSQYKVMTLDLNLPGENGINFLDGLRRSVKTHALPVVVVSVEADEARHELNGGAIGVADWLQKPIDAARLQNTIKQIMTPGRLPRVLHVEDEADVHNVIRTMLQGQCELAWAPTLRASREALEKESYDLVLLDISLPDGSGLDLLETIETQDTPPQVVIFSAHDVTEEYANRVSAVLIKSNTNNKDLARIITNAMKKEPLPGK
jgi:PAS domain S-box-containing protein